MALFDLETQRWVTQRKPTTSGISCITYSPETEAFIASSYDGHLYPIEARA